MKYKKSCLIFTATLSLTSLFLLTNSEAQSRTGEGLSRQISSLKNMIESFANDVRPRIQDLEDRENERTTCNNISGDTSLYWPNHPDADPDTGCVSHTDLATSANGCTSRPIRWGAGCSETAWGTAEGVSSTVTMTRARCSSGYSGSVVATCEDGDFVLTNPRCNYTSDPCK